MNFNVVTPPPLPPPIDIYANERPTERMFDNGVVGAFGEAGTGESPTPEGETYDYMVRTLIDDAVSFEEATLRPDREENLEYFYAEIPEPEGEGTSTAVSTDFRDTVMAIIPSLIRIFTSSEYVISCHPNYEGQEDAAKQCTDYLQYMFWEDNPGFLVLHDILKDALRCKIGVVKWWTETTKEVTEQLYRNISQDQLQMLIYENPSVQIVRKKVSSKPSAMPPPMSPAGPPDPLAGPAGAPPGGTTPPPGGPLPPPGMPPMGPAPAPVMYDEVVIRFVKSKPVTKIESVPLDEFRIDRRAKTVEQSILVGHDRVTTVSEMVQAGYSLDQIAPYVGEVPTYTIDRQYRNPGIDETQVNHQLSVRYGCYFIRIDKDGDGIDELREIHTVGPQHVIIHDEVVQYANFAVWSPDPEPHTLVGDSPAELVKDIQRIKTNMLRGSLDSLAESIWPRTVFNETLANAEDVMNDEIGASIRTRGDPASTVQTLNHTFVGQPVFDMFQVMETLRQQRTGISDASKGVDPRALQSTALQGVDAIITGAQERIELCARVLAETGMKDLFKGLLRECINSPNQERTLQLRGKWVTINPSTFDPTMRIAVNPTLGRGSDMTRLMVLQDIRQTQIMAMQQFGPDNPLCGPIEFRNTLTDMLEIGNIKSVDRYFKVITPDILAQISATPRTPDPAMVLAQAELEKTRAKMATEIAKNDFQDRKMRVDDDFRRDDLRVHGMLDAAQIIAQYGAHIDEHQLELANVANDTADLALNAQGQANDAQDQQDNTTGTLAKQAHDMVLGQQQQDTQDQMAQNEQATGDSTQ